MRTEGYSAMGCEHKTIRCTNGEFFCLTCGQRLEMPTADEVFAGAKELHLMSPKVEKEPGNEKSKRKTRKKAGDNE